MKTTCCLLESSRDTGSGLSSWQVGGSSPPPDEISAAKFGWTVAGAWARNAGALILKFPSERIFAGGCRALFLFLYCAP